MNNQIERKICLGCKLPFKRDYKKKKCPYCGKKIINDKIAELTGRKDGN